MSGTVPSLSWLASSQVEALTGLDDLIAETVADMREQGETVPQPLSERRYSGKFNLRVGESLHFVAGRAFLFGDGSLATGRSKAAVIVGHMLRWPFHYRNGGQSTSDYRIWLDERTLAPYSTCNARHEAWPGHAERDRITLPGGAPLTADTT